MYNMQITKTNQEFLIFYNSVKAYLGNSKKNKLSYVLEKIISSNENIIESYKEEVEDLKIDLASVDDRNNLLINDKGNYSYTKEALKSLKKKLKDLDNKKIIVEGLYIKKTDYPKDIEQGWLNLFEEYVSDKIKDEE